MSWLLRVNLWPLTQLREARNGAIFWKVARQDPVCANRERIWLERSFATLSRAVGRCMGVTLLGAWNGSSPWSPPCFR